MSYSIGILDFENGQVKESTEVVPSIGAAYEKVSTYNDGEITSIPEIDIKSESMVRGHLGQIVDPNVNKLAASMGQLTGDNAQSGSATLVGNRIIITAAHCCFMFKDSSNTQVTGMVQNMKFLQGHPDSWNPHDVIKVVYFNEFRANPAGNRHLDLAFCVLKQPTTSYSNIPMVWNLFNQSTALKVDSYGYPLKAPYPEPINFPVKQFLYRLSGTAQTMGQTGMVRMSNFDFTGGASGGPWLTMFNGKPHICGINKDESGASPYFSDKLLLPLIQLAQKIRDAT